MTQGEKVSQELAGLVESAGKAAGTAAPVEGPMSPARKRPGGKVRAVGSMNPQKFCDLVAEMEPYADKDPEAYAKVQQELADRKSGRSRKGLV